MVKIDNVNYGVTPQGNLYEKTNSNKKIYAAIGAGYVGARMIYNEVKAGKSELPTTKEILKSIVEKGYKRGIKETASKYMDKGYIEEARELFTRAAHLDVKSPVYRAFAKTKNRRIAFVSAVLAGTVAVKMGFAALIGHLLGRGVDKLENIHAAQVVDRHSK